MPSLPANAVIKLAETAARSSANLTSAAQHGLSAILPPGSFEFKPFSQHSSDVLVGAEPSSHTPASLQPSLQDGRAQTPHAELVVQPRALSMKPKRKAKPGRSSNVVEIGAAAAAAAATSDESQDFGGVDERPVIDAPTESPADAKERSECAERADGPAEVAMDADPVGTIHAGCGGGTPSATAGAEAGIALEAEIRAVLQNRTPQAEAIGSRLLETWLDLLLDGAGDEANSALLLWCIELSVGSPRWACDTTDDIACRIIDRFGRHLRTRCA